MKQVVSLILALTLITWCQAAPISEVVRKSLAMGDKTNRLIDEKSPYLLQHAFNPVDWYPWGEEPFAKAKAEDKPIFLSVGYSTCHWCHVMERESFENPEIAALLNKWFVCIKVDREERPDIDQLYMAATQAMTGSGGWPMSVFLLPDGKPFYAGTYFPPESQYGRPGFSDVLTSIHDAWQTKRGDLAEAATRLVTELEKNAQGSQTAIISKNILENAYNGFAKDFATFIQDTLYDRKTKELTRRYRQGESGLSAQLDDYAFLVYGLIELYQATQDPDWLRWAIELTEEQIRVFLDKKNGGFYDSVVDSTLPFRMKGDYDGAEPGANAVAALNLLKLGTITANNEWAGMVHETIEAFSSILNKYPQALPLLLSVRQLSTTKPIQVVIAGIPDSSATKRMILKTYKTYDPGRVILLADNSFNQQFLVKKLPFIEGMGMIDKRTTAYVCQNFTCQLPVNDVVMLQKKLKQK